MWSWMRFSFFPETISRIGVLLGEKQIPVKCKPIEELCVFQESGSMNSICIFGLKESDSRSMLL